MLSRLQTPPLSRKARLSPQPSQAPFVGNSIKLRVITSAGSFLEEAFAVPPSCCPSPPRSAASRDASGPASSSKTSQDHLFHMRPVACSPGSVSTGAGWFLAAGDAIQGIGTGVSLGYFSPPRFCVVFFFLRSRFINPTGSSHLRVLVDSGKAVFAFELKGLEEAKEDKRCIKDLNLTARTVLGVDRGSLL